MLDRGVPDVRREPGPLLIGVLVRAPLGEELVRYRGEAEPLRELDVADCTVLSGLPDLGLAVYGYILVLIGALEGVTLPVRPTF